MIRVELDDFLGGAPVQHREVQGYETELFLSYPYSLSLCSMVFSVLFSSFSPHILRYSSFLLNHSRYFPQHIQILGGGIESGFNHVKPTEYSCRLLHVKGKKLVRVMQVCFSFYSLFFSAPFVSPSLPYYPFLPLARFKRWCRWNYQSSHSILVMRSSWMME